MTETLLREKRLLMTWPPFGNELRDWILSTSPGKKSWLTSACDYIVRGSKLLTMGSNKMPVIGLLAVIH